MFIRKILFSVLIVFILAICGCGGSDDDTTSVVAAGVTNASTLIFQTTIPRSVLSSSIHASLQPQDITVTLASATLNYVGDDGTYMVFQRTVTRYENASVAAIIDAGGGITVLTVQIGTKAPVSFSVQLDTTTSGATSKIVEISLAITTNSDGTYTVTVTTGNGVFAPSAPVATSAVSLGIKNIEYMNADGIYAELSSGTTNFPLSNAKLRITFDALVVSATTSFSIKAVSGTTQVTLTQTDLLTGLLSITQTDSATNSVLVVSLQNNTTSGKHFRPNSTYTLSFVSSSVKRKSDGTTGIPTGTSITRTLSTKQYVELIDWTGKYSTATTNQVSSTQNYIELLFDYPLKNVDSITGSVNLKRYDLNDNLESNTTIDSAKISTVAVNNIYNKMTIYLKSSFVANKKYVVTYISGELFDQDNNPVTHHIPITFYTK